MLIFATVQWKNYLGRGIEYTNTLYDMITRNLKEGMAGKFVVFTDDITPSQGYHPDIELRPLPGFLDGYYNKLALFDDKAFAKGDRIVFLDLDTVITGSLDDIAAYTGPFATLRDVYRPNGLQSSVMLWEGGFYGFVWDSYQKAGYPRLMHGDQQWIEKTVPHAAILQKEFPDLFVSFKRDARFGIPPKASVCFFHGQPRPHECTGWVEHVWKVGGATSSQLELVGNTDGDQIKANIQRSENDPDAQWLQPIEAHKRVAVICAGGPSLKQEIPSLGAHVAAGATVFACNNAAALIKVFGISTDFHVVLDARPENAVFVDGIGPNTICLYASQCDKKVHDKAEGRLVMWHPAFDGIMDIAGDKERTFIGGGTTCGMKAATIAWALGYRAIHLYGFDSCFQGSEHHAYPQSLNDKDQMIDVEFAGKSYKCAPWMIQQAEDFETFGPQLMDHGVELHVHGDGLIPDIARQFAKGVYRPEAADFRAMAILERLQGIESPKVAEIGVFAGDLSRRLLARRPDLSLFMVDSWEGNPKAEYAASDDFHAKLDQKQQDDYFKLAERVTSFAIDRRTIMRMDSKNAAHAMPDNSLDMVFIDADHSYEGCKSDIEAYYSKVRPGGFISGHDYANDDWRFGPMVKRAVDEFIQEQGLDLELGENYTWFAAKPDRSINV